MIDRQKLLQWISDKNYVYSVPDNFGDSDLELAEWKGCRKMLLMMARGIELGEFNAEEEEPGPRFKMDADGNLSIVEEE